jgi:hypothetical protein
MALKYKTQSGLTIFEIVIFFFNLICGMTMAAWLGKKFGVLGAIGGFLGGFAVGAASIVGLLCVLTFWSKARRNKQGESQASTMKVG